MLISRTVFCVGCISLVILFTELLTFINRFYPKINTSRFLKNIQKSTHCLEIYFTLSFISDFTSISYFISVTLRSISIGCLIASIILFNAFGCKYM